MIAMFRQLSRHRDLLYMLSRRDVTVKYKQSIMGFLWAILMPLLITSGKTTSARTAAAVTNKTKNAKIKLNFALNILFRGNSTHQSPT